MSCNTTYHAPSRTFKYTGPGLKCKPITQKSTLKMSNNKKRANAAMRTRHQNQAGGVGEVGKVRPLCPANNAIPPKKSPAPKAAHMSGAVTKNATMALHAAQLANAANKTNSSCSQSGGRRRTNRKRHNRTKSKKGRYTRRMRRHSKSRKTRK